MNVDEELKRSGSDQSGAMSAHVKPPVPDGIEDELLLLRAENALLKKKVEALEKGNRGDKTGLKFVLDGKEIQQIDNLLKKAEDAKMEAMNYAVSTSREKLSQDVRVLQSILQKAKAERQAFKKRVKSSEEALRVERVKAAQEEARFQVDREIFAKIIEDDRDAYNREVDILVQKVAAIQKEKYGLFLWAKERQEEHLQEIRKLTRALRWTKHIVDDQVTKSLRLEASCTLKLIPHIGYFNLNLQATKSIEILSNVRQVHSAVFRVTST